MLEQILIANTIPSWQNLLQGNSQNRGHPKAGLEERLNPLS
jgi:hypothetical protein